MARSNWTLLFGVSSLFFLVIALTGKTFLYGALLGYVLSFVNILWLHRDTLRNVDVETLIAVQRMRRSFFARLGMITLVVVAVERYQSEWLLPLALGIALGLVVFLIASIKDILTHGKG